jgi:soluble lytic murein transglycosylase-like protein
MSRAPLRRGDLRIPTLPGEAAPQPIAVAEAAPLPGLGGLASGLAERIDRLRAGLDRAADAEAAERAFAAGTEAGEAAPGARMEGGGALYRTVFNRAAADAALRRLEISARGELDRLAREHPADPAAFNAGAVSWRDQAAGALPEGLRARFLARFDAGAQPYSGTIQEQLQAQVADDARATWDALLPQRIAALERAAARALDDPQAAAALRLEEDQAVAEAVALGPRHAFRIGARQYPADPSRAGALSAQQVAGRVQAIEQARTEALVIAAWRGAGGGMRWIEEFERAQTAPGAGLDEWIGRQARAAEPAASPERLLQRLPAAWIPVIRQAARDHGLPPELFAALIALESGGRAEARSAAGAVGPAQILPSTARDPGFGLDPLPEAALTDPAQAIPWAARYLAALRDRFGGDLARALAAYNAGPGRVEQAEREGAALPAETRRYLATLLPLAGALAGPALPAAEAHRLAARLRGLHAAAQQAEREGQAEARAVMQRRITENLAAIEVGGTPVHRLTPAELETAGLDATLVLERERAASERFAAGETARRTTDPAALAALAEDFAPGTPNFAADPAAATRLLKALRGRGVAVASAGLAERVRDLAAEAEATGQADALDAAEAEAAGLAPEKRASINRDLARRAELARLRAEAERLPEADRAAAIARFPVHGEGAAANAERVRAMAEAFEARDKAVRRDAAAYALAGSPEARELAGRVATGDLEALKPLGERLRAEQEVLGIDPALRRDLPKPLVEALFATVADQPDADAAWAVLDRLTNAVGVGGVERLAAEWRPEGDRRDDRRRAIVVAAAKSGSDPALARDLIRGAFVLRDNPLVDASRLNVQSAVDAHVGGALENRPDVRADLTAAALALAAREAAAAGRLSGVWRQSAFVDHLARLMPVDDWEGGKVVLPPGMDARSFRALMRRLPPARLEGAVAGDGRPITPDMLARGGFALSAVGPGRYALTYGGRAVLDAARPGQTFVLDLNGAEPAPPDQPAIDAGPSHGGRLQRALPRRLAVPGDEPDE